MKKLIILRGVPSSGKSTKAKQLAVQATKDGYSVVVCSADNYFLVGDQYYFNRDELGKAHAQCRNLAENAMKNGVNVVIIDNTNTQAKEAKSYIDNARLLGYNVEVVEAPGQHLDAETLFARNVHNVPIENIRSMIARYESMEDFKGKLGLK